MNNQELLETAYQVATIVVTLSIGDYVNKQIKLKKTSVYDGKIISNEAPMIEVLSRETRLKLIKQIENDDQSLISDFLLALRTNFDSQTLAILYNNLTSLEVVKKSELWGLMLRLAASYNARKNRVQIFNKKSFYHEMFHVSSSRFDKENDIIYSGFMQQKGMAVIGKAITEGTSQMLAEKYFRKESRPSAVSFVDNYSIEVNFAKMIQLLYDDEVQFERYYFSADLPGFIASLERYAPKEVIIKMIKDIDYISDHYRGLIPGPKYRAFRKVKETKWQLYEWFMANRPNALKEKIFKEMMFSNKIEELYMKRDHLVELSHEREKLKQTAGNNKNYITKSLDERIYNFNNRDKVKGR